MKPVDVDVDSDVTELFVVLRPVDSEFTLDDVDVDNDVIELVAVLRPVDSELTLDDVDVDSDVIELVAVLRPVDVDVDNELTLDDVEVDSDVIELVAVLRPVDVDVDRLSIAVFVAYSCEPLIASVLVAITRPAATFVIWRSAPGAPTLTTLDGFVPA
ncbi:ATPase [Burkholderia arboris]|uniref:ATPase n=1 Tax=Burkholderia arboris TaxID=488730 RepID=A0A9Q9SRX7_9BURK|nr:ATPase [Burkholderia arboris]